MVNLYVEGVVCMLNVGNGVRYVDNDELGFRWR